MKQGGTMRKIQFPLKGFILLIGLLMCSPMMAFASIEYIDDFDAIEKTADSVFMLETYNTANEQIAIGSGFLAFDKHLLVTNYHVIEDASYVIAISDDSDRFLINQACVADKDLDIAILYLGESGDLDPLEFDVKQVLKRSMKVVAIGSPAGLMNTVSIGNISSFYKNSDKDWIQFTAPISSGSSGGPLLNAQGKVIGVTTATYASAQNVNMAVRATDVTRLYEQWNGKVSPLSSVTGTEFVHTSQQNAEFSEDNSTNTVYISSGGKKYHNNPHCSRMKNATKIDLIEAIERGYEPCNKCYR